MEEDAKKNHSDVGSLEKAMPAVCKELLELMERLGLERSGGAVRIGFTHYNTFEEVDRVLEELAALA